MLDVTPHQGNPDFVLSLARGLLVIEAFQGCRDGVTVGDVAARTGLSRASARRLLLTLEMLGYASHSGSVYRLGSRVLRFGVSPSCLPIHFPRWQRLFLRKIFHGNSMKSSSLSTF